MNNLTAAVIAGIILCFSAIPVASETAEEKGRWIAEQTDRRDLGWGDSEAHLTMTLRNREGQSSVRRLSLASLEVDDPMLGDRSLTLFAEPRDIEGTAFLSHTRIHDPDDQWLYLPALKRVKRISSQNKSGPFVGSEFAYEDLVSQEVERYTYKYLRDEPCGERTCYVTERFPVYEHSGYTRQVVWIDHTDFQPRKIEFYDRKGDLLKTLDLLEYRQYLGKYWRAHRLEMQNRQTGKSTTLSFSDYAFGLGLGEGDFQKSRLERLR
ncbi:MAG: outer membrane lipoprotein-sorting protein [Thalassobaculum sp.]|uniref:outer membrane lipoprotein-sorting protein n=1 Tax=Thalassobaculum sp. TaxID=2022740 RepID=UPI0032EB5088